MRDWKATVRGWNRRENTKTEAKPTWYGKNIKEEKATKKEIEELERKMRNEN